MSALANPDRARLIDALAAMGMSSTSRLASELGLATGSVSHHLKQLTEAGLVEPVVEGNPDRRSSFWQLVSRGIRYGIGASGDRPAENAAAVAAEEVMLERQFDRASRFISSAGPPWDSSAYSGHFWLSLSPEELRQLGQDLDELLLKWRRRSVPDDDMTRESVLVIARAFPTSP